MGPDVWGVASIWARCRTPAVAWCALLGGCIPDLSRGTCGDQRALADGRARVPIVAVRTRGSIERQRIGSCSAANIQVVAADNSSGSGDPPVKVPSCRRSRIGIDPHRVARRGHRAIYITRRGQSRIRCRGGRNVNVHECVVQQRPLQIAEFINVDDTASSAGRTWAAPHRKVIHIHGNLGIGRCGQGYIHGQRKCSAGIREYRDSALRAAGNADIRQRVMQCRRGRWIRARHRRLYGDG
jgi:hypothetical protein